MAVTWAMSQPVHWAVMCARIRSICSLSAPASRYMNWAYALLSMARRLIKPSWKNARENTNALDLAMIVLSRSKNAAMPEAAGLGELTVGQHMRPRLWVIHSAPVIHMSIMNCWPGQPRRNDSGTGRPRKRGAVTLGATVQTSGGRAAG